MIKSLNIRNYALIEKLEMKLFPGLNIITGETGAGKSIILGSLELAMGKRADTGVLYDKNENCVVELEYNISEYGLRDFFRYNELEYSDDITITRLINPSGKSRAFINDEPVNLNILKDLTAQLILMHRQFDNLELMNSDYQLKIVDNFANNFDLISDYKAKFDNYKKTSTQLKELIVARDKFAKEMQFVEFQFNELNTSKKDITEFENNSILFQNLSNSENIKNTLFQVFDILSEGEDSVLNKLENISRDLNNLELINKDFVDSRDMITEIIEKLTEISNKYIEIAEDSEIDEEKSEELKNKIDFVNNLIVKYKVRDVNDLEELRNNLELQLRAHFDVDEKIQKLEKEIDGLNLELQGLSISIHNRREKGAKDLVMNIESILKELSLPNTKVQINIEKTEEFLSNGKDKVNFMFSANKGSEFKLLKEVVSGGELSRLSLSIESAIAGKMSLPTMIFDEIEAGISGEVARKMGKILKQMSNKHQIINITHSPQIAAKADYHYFVFKNIVQNKTITDISLLGHDDRINEIAKMLSGEPPTEGAIRNAIELIEN
jgi:DNA repair protein RecN (Recombination protein N)